MRAARRIRMSKWPAVTQKAAAEAISVSESTLSKFEMGARMRESAELAYAKFLGVPLEELLAKEPEQVPA